MMLSIIAVKKEILPILKKNSVTRAGIFGSVARGEASNESDVDILIEFGERKGLFDLVRLERELKVALGRKVDLLTYDSINHILKEKILGQEVRRV